MDKNYNFKELEDKIYGWWEESGAMAAPEAAKAQREGQKPFTIIMPPPNANDPLHVGHAMFVSVEDILIRYHRMLGEATLWLPGTDHAGIETQFVFEKKLAKEGKSRFDYPRDELYQMIAKYVEENSGISVEQMKKLGASADWSRFKFNLDSDVVKTALDTFVKLHNDGLVYRGLRLVNYCTKCGTSYSELEVNYEEQLDKIYEIKYGPLVVATTRPETMLGDVAVAVNPNDQRYAKLIGTKVPLPLSEREISVIGDESVDMEFGTGVVKVTPAHDPADWAMAERQGWNLDQLVADHQIIGNNGKMTKAAGKYAGLNVNEARQQVINDLGNLVLSVKDYSHNVGHCYRCGRVIEPLPMKQFFIKVKPLAAKVLEALDKEEVKILGTGREKILRDWLVNLRDWNVSRQIVWGIRIPVWYKDLDKTEYKVSLSSPGEGWTQETDTFDTWFSSGQWPVSTLINGKKGDFEYYYPTSVMETGYDILTFWVMRMLLLGIYLTGRAPFKEVYLHGLVRDEKGQKMSKSKGNVINPIELVDKYGADALRMALVMGTTAGQDSSTGENKVRGMRNLANKIWNAARFVIETKNEAPENKEFKLWYSQTVPGQLSSLLNQLRVGQAAEYIYEQFWHEFCDKWIEETKQGKLSGSELKEGFETIVKLLHPFVPFVTEAVWQEMGKEKRLISETWPK